MIRSKIIYTQRSATVEVSKTHTNTAQDVIVITEDKLNILLMQHLEHIDSRRAWQTPLALLITIILVLTTTDFQLSFGIPAAYWFAVFFLSAIICSVWLCQTLYKMSKHMSIEDLLAKIKNEGNNKPSVNDSSDESGIPTQLERSITFDT